MGAASRGNLLSRALGGETLAGRAKGRGRGSAGLAPDELRGQIQGLRRGIRPCDATEQDFRQLLAQLVGEHAYRSQRRVKCGSLGNIVEPRYAEVLGNSETTIA